jgi:hypothetical protein
MITDNSNGRLEEIISFARKHKISQSFDEIYYLLENYSKKNHDVVLYRGYLPLSLEFSVSFEGEKIVGGSIIFHGLFDSVDLSTFSLSLSTGREVSWKLEV